ncbi:MAG TPA: sugar transferase, partial [Bacteroidales bacterium]|nr:sugar transferase [Bacteroidales bacterium]
MMFELKEVTLKAPESAVQKKETNNRNQAPMLKDDIVMSDYLCSQRKRVFDLVFSVISLPLLLPLTGLSALLVLLTMGMPVMFKQKRIGR